MVNNRLIDVVNSGDAWAFVGNGCSLGTGIPTWEELLILTKNACEASAQLSDREEKNVNAFIKQGKLTSAFTVLKDHYGSREVDDVVSKIISQTQVPSDADNIVTSWPFAGYITTNYDNLVERALARHGGWIPVGNTANENAKMCGDISKVVWHPHGGASLGNKNSRLVLASTDYDEIYPNGSPTLAALEAFFRLKRLVFVGFGFRDEDLILTLEKVGRFITPSRPAFAFIANADEARCRDFWERFKIEVIPYRAKGNDHSDLLHLLEYYGSFILDRSTRFGSATATPDYDPETVGLLTSNRLIRNGWDPQPDKLESIARGLILSRLSTTEYRSVTEISTNLLDEKSDVSISEVLEGLIQKGYLEKDDEKVRVTTEGDKFKSQGKQDFEILRDQFLSVLESRAGELTTDTDVVKNVSGVAARYLEKICRDRGLGVSQQLVESGETQIKARAVALLQDAKSELAHAKDRETALLVVKVINGALTYPKQEEKKYLGILTQAYFTRHLLGLDPTTIGIKKEGLRRTVFICDSNITIPLLAEGSVGHEYAVALFRKISTSGAPIITSDWLVEECVEHARWAWDLLRDNGPTSHKVIDAVRGTATYKQNAFLTGYLGHPKFGPGVFFKSYFAYVFGNEGERPDIKAVSDALVKRGIPLQQLDGWVGFSQELFVVRDLVQKEIERRRRNNNTFKHPRQVKAEAEVVVSITGVRRRQLGLVGHDTEDGFFLSHSRVVDNINGQAKRITIQPESLLDWILSTEEIKEEDANALYDQMLWELSKEGIDVISNKQLLSMFANTIDVSRIRLDEIVSEHRDIIRERYGSDPETAFSDVDPLVLPGLVDEVNRNIVRVLEDRLVREKQLRAEADKRAKNAIKDVQEYERFKAKKQEKKAKGIRRERAAASRPAKKKKR